MNIKSPRKLCLIIILSISFVGASALVIEHIIRTRKIQKWEESHKVLINKNTSNNNETGIDEHYKFLQQLRKVKSAPEDEKWRIVSRYFSSLYSSSRRKRDYQNVEEYIVVFIIFPDDVSDVLLCYYPEIVYRLPFTLQDLKKLGGFLDSQEPIVWGVEHNGIYEYRNFVMSEPAQQWIQNITGKHFENKAEFENWFNENEKYLNWNAKSGKFEINRE